MLNSYYDVKVSAKQIIVYLEVKLQKFEASKEKWGMEDRETIRLFDEMIACKEMAEVLIGAPVNLQKDGKVTIGF